MEKRWLELVSWLVWGLRDLATWLEGFLPELDEPSLDEVTAAMKELYPAERIARQVESFSPFYRSLKR